MEGVIMRVELLNTDTSVPNTDLPNVDAETLGFIMQSDRITYNDSNGAWHTADVVRRIFDATGFDGALVRIVVTD